MGSWMTSCNWMKACHGQGTCPRCRTTNTSLVIMHHAAFNPWCIVISPTTNQRVSGHSMQADGKVETGLNASSVIITNEIPGSIADIDAFKVLGEPSGVSHPTGFPNDVERSMGVFDQSRRTADRHFLATLGARHDRKASTEAREHQTGMVFRLSVVRRVGTLECTQLPRKSPCLSPTPAFPTAGPISEPSASTIASTSTRPASSIRWRTRITPFSSAPRRFGKSCWISLLENYYDRNRTGEFEALFGGTDIGAPAHAESSSLRHRALQLLGVRRRPGPPCSNASSSTAIRNSATRSEGTGTCSLKEAIRCILAPDSIDAKLYELFLYSSDHRIALYVLIDEYDNFANTVLAHHGQEAYRTFTHGSGFYRNFFATLKAGAGQSDGGLQRLFITGGLADHDGRRHQRFQHRAQHQPATGVQRDAGLHGGGGARRPGDVPELRGVRIRTSRPRSASCASGTTAIASPSAPPTVDLYNTDMVLYYLKASVPNKPMPDNLIDDNVRIDYGKLRHLLVVNRQLDGNFDQLREIIGEEQVDCELQSSFPPRPTG